MQPTYCCCNILQHTHNNIFTFQMKPQINCNSEEWRTKVLPNCIFGLVFFTAGIPIMFICMFLYTRKDRYNPMFLKSYAIFWNKYQPGFYWWEMMYTTRKLAMAIIIIFLRDYYLFQATVNPQTQIPNPKCSSLT